MAITEIFRKKSISSGCLAKDRLKLVLISDRAKCSPGIINQMKDDIINVISKYMEIDAEGLDIKIIQAEYESKKDCNPAIHANIPIRQMKFGYDINTGDFSE